MAHKGPHISIASEHVVFRVLGLGQAESKTWPESVFELARELAEELFLLRYNPFIDPGMVMESVRARFRQAKPSLSREYVQQLSKGIKRYWKDFEEDQRFRKDLMRRLAQQLDPDSIDGRPNTLVESSTDATDLRMDLPLLVVTPKTAEQIQFVVRLANEMDFALIPRGGGTGLTGGAIPSGRRAVIVSLAKLKEIKRVDPAQMSLCAQSGVITIDAIKAADQKGMLFTVDPASKTASSLGGNISENSGGPFAFEYGTTLDNILSYRMVTPTGELIEVRRKDHPGHKILPEETAVFEVVGLPQGGRGPEAPIDVLSLSGSAIRGKDLGKDVTNKFLGGLPGVQKEGVDGIIIEACFSLHKKLAHSRVLCLEFFGRTMHNAVLVIKDLVALRDAIRREGDLVKMSALEEFGIKYVQAIEYQKKSLRYEGDPISVLILQLDADDEAALDAAVDSVVNAIVEPYDNVDAFVAEDEKQAEVFWEDRHKLSAISKRTSGFKINEDVVIPIEVIPAFSDFLEGLNLTYAAKAYRTALIEAARLDHVAVDDEFIEMERDFTTAVLKGRISAKELNDQELEVQASFFFQDLRSRYPESREAIEALFQRMLATRVVIANHMHAGDGNCHVNVPVNSNDPDMLRLAEEAVEHVFAKVVELKGAVSGEHGIGITKISFLSEAKIAALKVYKNKIDPRNILNPGKLTQRELPVTPYTFSFNRLIQDIRKSGLPDKERLINLLQNIQICTRCGKCKQVCPMFFPQKSLLFHPRNKNISLGALIEAIYYSQVNRGEPEKKLLDELRRLMEHCTGCGKCTAVCPVKINTPEVTLHLRAFLDDKGAAGHPIKRKVLDYLSRDPARRVPQAAKLVSVAQAVQNRLLGLVPAVWRARLKSPLFSGPGPTTGYNNLITALHLEKGSIFLPAAHESSLAGGAEPVEAVFYFPGCGGGLFYRDIGLAGVTLLLDAGIGVILPREHLCCGYPLLASGCEEAFTTNQARNMYAVNKLLEDARAEGLHVSTLVTACGSCRDALKREEWDAFLHRKLARKDLLQFLLERNQGRPLPVFSGRGAGRGAKGQALDQTLVYHASCHAEWSGLGGPKAAEAYRQGLSRATGATTRLSPGCCGESGLGALTSPSIYNKLRERKKDQLDADMKGYDPKAPLLVGCPSCKIGVARCLMGMKTDREVLHTLEYLVRRVHGPKWRRRIRRAALSAAARGFGVRLVQFPDS